MPLETFLDTWTGHEHGWRLSPEQSRVRERASSPLHYPLSARTAGILYILRSAQPLVNTL